MTESTNQSNIEEIIASVPKNILDALAPTIGMKAHGKFLSGNNKPKTERYEKGLDPVLLQELKEEFRADECSLTFWLNKESQEYSAELLSIVDTVVRNKFSFEGTAELGVAKNDEGEELPVIRIYEKEYSNVRATNFWAQFG